MSHDDRLSRVLKKINRDGALDKWADEEGQRLPDSESVERDVFARVSAELDRRTASAPRASPSLWERLSAWIGGSGPKMWVIAGCASGVIALVLAWQLGSLASSPSGDVLIATTGSGDDAQTATLLLEPEQEDAVISELRSLGVYSASKPMGVNTLVEVRAEGENTSRVAAFLQRYGIKVNPSKAWTLTFKRKKKAP